MLIDYYADSEHAVLKKIAKYIPEELWEEDITDCNLIPENSWAYLEKESSGDYIKRFPVNNKMGAILSRLYLEENRSEMTKEAFSQIERRIDDSLESMGVGKFTKIAKLMRKKGHAGNVDEPGPPSWEKYFLEKIGSSNVRDVSHLIRDFSVHFDKMAADTRAEIAKEIVSKARALEIRISRNSKLDKYARLDYSKLSVKAATYIKMRQPYYSEEMNKIANELIETIAEHPPSDYK